MLFRKSVQEKIDDVLTRIRLKTDEFLEIPGMDRRIARDGLRYSDGTAVILDFAESQLLTRKLSKDGLKVRLPMLAEDYASFQNHGNGGHQYEWKAEFLDGSFLMLNPEVRRINQPREYDFYSPLTSLVEVSKYCCFKENAESCWFGVTKDEYDRAAFISNSYNGKYSAGAIPPLHKELMGVRLVTDDK